MNRIIRKKKSWLCLFLVLAMAVSGMCFADVKADSFFGSADSGNIFCSLVSPPLSHSSQIRAEEISGLRPLSRILEKTERVLTQNSVRVGLVLILLAVLLAGSHYFLKVKMLCAYHRAASSDVIIRYIHHQDGMKG